MSPRSSIAHYKLTAKVGEGGMGTVYRATDTKLNREVAVKILPDIFCADPDRLARFTREAQVLASLNHPNIAAIYGLEDRALILEYVPGCTLQERIAQGRLPIDEALPIALQLIDALEYAHDRGVVHRDLKPANLKVTNDHRLKILDFGLAKALSSGTATADPAASPTLTMRATMAGTIMGTAAYMSPEQARGGDVDKRADIWAFGVVVFEMLTGRGMFSGDTVSDILASVLRAEVDWSALPAETPLAIRRLLRRCLERDLKRRLRDIGDAHLEIEEAMTEPLGPRAPTDARATRRPLRYWPIALGFAVAGIVVAWTQLRETPPPSPVVRFNVAIPGNAGLGINFRMAVSPDGKRLAFIASSADSRPILWVRSLDSVEARILPGTENLTAVFWSPDSRWIGFAADGKIKKIESFGGPSQTLCRSPSVVSQGAWSRDGVILFGGLPNGELFRVAESGGVVGSVIKPDLSRGELGYSFPQFLPDGRHFIYFASATGADSGGVYLATLDGKLKKPLLSAKNAAMFAVDSGRSDRGHLLFLKEGVLMAQVLDLSTFALTGEAVAIAEQTGNFLAYGYFSASANGVLAYRAGGEAYNTQLIWFDRTGKALGAVGPPASYNDLALSPDGKRVAANQSDPLSRNRDIWLMDVARGVPQRFTFDPAQESAPVWSPDSNRLAFASNRGGQDNLYMKAMRETGSDELLLKSELKHQPLDWSADGRFLLFYEENPKTKADLWILPLTQGGKPAPFLQTPLNETQGQFSRGKEGAPGGSPRWVAYSSDESGVFQIYVQPFRQEASAAGAKFQVSTGGGLQPRWRADSKEIFYIAPDGQLMSVAVKTSPQFEAATPRPLFATRIFMGPTTGVHIFRYAVAPDGSRFLINSVQQEEKPSWSPITVVLNWTAGLKK